MLKRISAAEAFKTSNVPQPTDDDLSLDMDQDFSNDELSLETEKIPAETSPKLKNASYSRVSSPSPLKPTSSNHQTSHVVTSEELQLEKEPIKVRETGFWRWKRVIIPPNAYVVHTRIGCDDPVTIGLGKSFRYNPYTDAYLVVPAAMQTIGIVARSITKEKQGINILAYLQWQISDFSIAYRQLDVTDIHDPLGIVNAQLGEQAEAAIKDKIATMSVEEVLTDKAPIIEELTTRLQTVTEGRNHEDGITQEGLGIKIVTVQIREAFVSSQKLWQDLQAPFRHQQEQVARISRLTMQNEVRKKELESRQLDEIRQAETLAVIENVKQNKQTEAVQLKLVEEANRFSKEQETIQQKIQLEERTTLAKQASKLRIQTQEQDTAQQKIQLEEQTVLAKQTSDQRLQAQQARLAHENQLAAQQHEQAKTLEQARLDHEAHNKQKTLQTEQALHTLAEENRSNEANMQAEQQRLEQKTQLKKQIAALKLLIQEQNDLIEVKALEARLTREKQERLAELELEEAHNRVKMTLQEREIDILHKTQEVRNLINESDLLRRLIDKSAEIVAEMPDIQELKVLQTGNDMNFEMLSAYVAKMLAVAEHLGVPFKLNHTASSPKKKQHKSS